MTVEEFASFTEPAPVIIESLELALYQVKVSVDGREKLLVDNDGKVFRRRNLQQVRDALRLMPVATLHLRHRSAYDEMIGQPLREGSNALQVPLSFEAVPPSQLH